MMATGAFGVQGRAASSSGTGRTALLRLHNQHIVLFVQEPRNLPQARVRRHLCAYK